MTEKILHAQEAGAIAVLILDDGSCTEDFDCGRMGKKAEDLGFGWKDKWENWVPIFIPSFLMTKMQSERLLRILPRTKQYIEGYGVQYVHGEL